MSNNFKLDKFIPLDLIDELGIIGIFIEYLLKRGISQAVLDKLEDEVCRSSLVNVNRNNIDI